MAISTPARRRPEAEPQEWIVVRFLREVYDELRKVVWPTPQELYRYTLVVVTTVIVMAIFIGAVDAGVSQFAQKVIYNGLNSTTK